MVYTNTKGYKVVHVGTKVVENEDSTWQEVIQNKMKEQDVVYSYCIDKGESISLITNETGDSPKRRIKNMDS